MNREKFARILVVDDEPQVARMIGRYLTQKGYNVMFASTGEEAIRETKIRRPHLVLLDMLMPGRGGLTALKEIKQADPAVRVIMITGVQEDDLAQAAMHAGAADYLTKPLDLEYLGLTVEAQLTLAMS